MLKRISCLLMVSLLLITALSGAFIHSAVASGLLNTDIHIRPDGSVDPSTAPIQRNGNIYTLTSDIFNNTIYIERNDTVLDGAGHNLLGLGESNQSLVAGINLNGTSNVVIENLRVARFVNGILVLNSSNITIEGNRLTENGNWSLGNGEAVILVNSSNNLMVGNDIENNTDGIFIWASSNNSITKNNIDSNNLIGAGIVGLAIGIIGPSNGNMISANNITDNFEGGVSILGIPQLGTPPTQNDIQDNNIAGTISFPFSTGISLAGADSNRVIGNNISNNHIYGIVSINSTNNLICHNNFADNEFNTTMTQAFSENSTNAWDDGTHGNFWNDYGQRYPDAQEIDNSGVWNTPYTILNSTRAPNGADNHPLLNPYPPSREYNVTIKAYCLTENANASVAIAEDGSPTGVDTPHTFTGLTRTHNFTVPDTDTNGHPFKNWSTGQNSTTVTVSSEETYIAYYQASVPSNNYTINFFESGLPQGTSWSVTLNNTTNSATTQNVTFAEPNGTYPFTVGSIFGYVCFPLHGNVTVNGQNITVSVTFQPLTRNQIFGDDFWNDTQLNTVLWRVNSPMLYNIAKHESSAFGEGVSVEYPDLPIGFSNQGLNWGMSGNGAMSGITSNIVFTPPYVVELNASISSMTGGNPISLFLTNNETSSFIAIFVSNSIWIQTAYDNPVDICDNVNNGMTYTFLINVTTSSLEVIVMKGGQQIADYSKNLGPLDDYAYFLTLGSFAGQIPGEVGGNSFAVDSCYTSAKVTSSSTWNLTVGVNDDNFQPLQNVNVVVTDLFGDINYTQNTDNTGTTRFTDLVSGFYTLGAWVSQGNENVTGRTSILIGNPSSPQQTDIYTTIVLSIPPLSDLSVRIPPLNENKRIGLAPLNDTFHADAAGWVGNYTYTWKVNGTAQQEKSNDFRRIFDSPGTYEAEVTVTSSGTWYGQPKGIRLTTSEVIPICVSNSPYLAYLNSTGDNFLSLSRNGATNQVILYIENGRVLIEANATDNALNVISVPEWLSILLGVENAWRGITFSSLVNGNDAAVDTGLIIEPGSTVDLNNASLPIGAPTGLESLKGYKFEVILNPAAGWALASDAVAIVFGMLGFVTTIASVAPGISGSDMSWIIQQVVQLLAEQGARLAIDISTNTKDICSALGSRAGEMMKSLCSALLEAIPEAIQRILLRYLGYNMASKICTALVSQVAHWAVKLASGLETLYLTAQFLVDAAAMLSTILPGPRSQEFNIADIKAMPSFTVKGHSPAPYVIVQKGAEIYGYDGSWVSSTSAFVSSDYTAEEYSFAIEDTGSVRLLVQAPPGESSSAYDITLHHNGTEAHISGEVTAGKPQTYTITYGPDSINVTAANFLWSPSSPVVNDIVTFNGSSSTAGQGTIVNYTWSFGDGQTGSGPIATHAYSAPGSYTVTLNVTDSQGDSGIEQQEVQVFQGGQYNISFYQTSVGLDFNGTVVTIDGANYTASDLPASFLWDNGSTHTFAFQSPLLVGSGAKEYDWTSTAGLSTLQSDSITVTGPGSVTGSYSTRVHDVAVTNVVAIVPHCSSKVGNDLWVFQGRPVYVNVTVSNKGNFTENVTVTLYYNSTANNSSKGINSQNVLLSAGQTQTIVFVWNTTAIPYCLNYTITAAATIPLDNNSTDNTLLCRPINIRIMGDINGDGKVDGKDIVAEAISFPSWGPNFLYPGSPPSARWNLDCDINYDNKIDGKDLVLVAMNFGK